MNCYCLCAHPTNYIFDHGSSILEIKQKKTKKGLGCNLERGNGMKEKIENVDMILWV